METDKKVRYDALIPREYTTGEGENLKKKTAWTRVGTAFPSSDGRSFNIEIIPNIAVSGRVVLRIYEPKPAAAE